MAPWNVSSDALTIEHEPRRSPSQWLRQNSLRIAVILGLLEAVFAWTRGFRVEIMLIGVLSVLAYLNLRHRIPARIRRPIWVVVMAQAIAGLLLPAVYVGIGIALFVGAIILVILGLVMLGDLRRS
jgi:hypothetical protein